MDSRKKANEQRKFRPTAVMTTPGLRQLAWCFVAGEDLDSGVAAICSLNVSGNLDSLNFEDLLFPAYSSSLEVSDNQAAVDADTA